MKTVYTKEFREQTISKAQNRGDRTVRSVAQELNMSHHTLKNWLKEEKQTALVKSSGKDSRRPGSWNGSERLEAVLETHNMDETARSAWCRSRGIYPSDLVSWRAALAESTSGAERQSQRTEIRSLREDKQRLERELRRKEKALAEAAALLVLEKKLQAFWAEQAD